MFALWQPYFESNMEALERSIDRSAKIRSLGKNPVHISDTFFVACVTEIRVNNVYLY